MNGMDSGRKNAYFAAANTEDGFYSRFGALFNPSSGEWQKIYIIKGGPGTGKSGFMRRVADAAEAHGYMTERFYCSSDAASLDGVRIPALGLALFDGTAPHTADPVYPGAVEEILNMGMFFDTERLRASLPEIRALQEENAAHHARARRFLHAAGAMRQTCRAFAHDAFLAQKAARAADRIVRACPAEREPVSDERLVTAISVQGMVHLPTAELQGKCIYVPELGGRSTLLFAALAEAAERRGVSYVRYASPLSPRETEGIFLPGTDTVYFTDRYGCAAAAAGRLNTARFFDAEITAGHRAAYRFAARCRETLEEGACEALAAAGDVHDRLEAHYIAAMDFDALNAFANRFLQRIFS